jgi:hypothetical protein
MDKSKIDLEHESNRLVIPDAFIINERIDHNIEIYHEIELRLPQNNHTDKIPPQIIENPRVIIIDL